MCVKNKNLLKITFYSVMNKWLVFLQITFKNFPQVDMILQGLNEKSISYFG